jgi:hypothetical protein
MPTQYSPVSVNLNININTEYGVTVFEDTPININNVVICKTKLGVSNLYISDDADEALFEFQGQDDDIAGRVISTFANEPNRAFLVSALAAILTNDNNDSDALNAYEASPFNNYIADVPQMKLYKSFGRLALAAYAYYLFGHVQATAAISNDTTIINFMNGEAENDAKIASTLASIIHTLNTTGATSICKQVIGQDASRTLNVDNDLTNPAAWQRLKWIAGDKIYVQVSLQRPDYVNVADGLADIQQYLPSANLIPSNGIKYNFEIELADDLIIPEFSYTINGIYTEGFAITSVSPINTGGRVTSYSISPELPTGMTLNTSTGLISGTPTVISSITNYTITGTNLTGSDTHLFNMQVASPKALYSKQNLGNCRDFCLDSENNYYVMMDTSVDTAASDINGDGSVIIPATINSASDIKTCLIKYNTNGTALFLKSIKLVGGIGSRVYSDSQNNAYVSYRNLLTSEDNIDINGDGSLIITPVASSNTNGMIVKYNSNGIAQWYKELNGQQLQAFRVHNNLIYAAYRCFSATTLDFNGDNSVTLSPLLNDRFIVVYNTSGVVISSKILTSSGANGINVQDIAIDSLSNVYLSGTTNNTSIIYLDPAETISIASVSGTTDAFLIKYNSLFDAQWVKVINGSAADNAIRCKVDLENNVYITGTYNSATTTDLGNGVILPITINGDGYIVKFNGANGQALWSKVFVAQDNPGTVTNVAFDSSNNVYITGGYTGSSPYTIETGVTFPATTGFAIYIIKYNSSGTYKWHKFYDGNGTESGRGILVDSSNNIAVLINVFNVTNIQLNGDNSVILNSSAGLVNFAVVKFGQN